MFKAWSFQLILKAVCHGTTAVEKAKLLTEHHSARTGNTRPLCAMAVLVFCDPSLFSVPSDSDGLVLIGVLGCVQVNELEGDMSFETKQMGRNHGHSCPRKYMV